MITESNCQLIVPRLARLFDVATSQASDAMIAWTGGDITLSLGDVHQVGLEEVSDELGIGGEPLVMVVLSLEGEFGGQFILTFDEENGRRRAASLLPRPVEPSDEWSDLECSALNETGNILACAYLRELSVLVGHELVPSPPSLMQEYGLSMVEQAIMPLIMECDQVLICQTLFQRNGNNMNWNVLFIPSVNLREAIESALDARSRDEK